MEACQVCLLPVYSAKTSGVVTGGFCAHKRWLCLSAGNILSLYPSLNASSGALWAFLIVCVRTDTDMQLSFFFFFPEIHPREAHQSSAHISAMNKTLLALKESTAQRARDLNRGTRQGSAVCLIWTTPMCLCSILLQPTSGGGREKSLSH